MNGIKPAYLIGGGIVVLGLIWYASKNAGSLGASVGGAVVDGVGGILRGFDAALPEPIRPSSDQNIIYDSISKAGQAVTGQPGWNLGGWIYDITHSNGKINN